MIRCVGFTIGGDATFKNLFLMPIISGHQFGFNLGFWFVIPLFFIEIFNLLFRFLLRKTKINDTFYFVCYFILGILAIVLANNGYNKNYWMILACIGYMPYFGLGTLYKSKLEVIDKKIPSSIYLLIIVVLQIILILFIGCPSFNYCGMIGFKKCAFINIIYAYLGIAFWFRIATIITPICGSSKIINLIADNTMSITANHLFGFFVLNSVYFGLSKHINPFRKFDIILFKNSVFYTFKINGLDISLLLYIICGIIFSILIQFLINKIKIFIYKMSDFEFKQFKR